MSEKIDKVYMVRKANFELLSTESCYSEETVKLKAPNESLALGERIIRLLKISSYNDTFGRWLCHYLSELLITERNSSGSERVEICSKIDEIVSRIKGECDNRQNTAEITESLQRVIRSAISR